MNKTKKMNRHLLTQILPHINHYLLNNHNIFNTIINSTCTNTNNEEWEVKEWAEEQRFRQVRKNLRHTCHNIFNITTIITIINSLFHRIFNSNHNIII